MPRPPKPDPRDAEIARLSAECEEHAGRVSRALIIIAEEMGRRERAERERREAIAALESAVSVAREAHRCWARGHGVLLRNILAALAGLEKGRRARIAAIHEVIAKFKSNP